MIKEIRLQNVRLFDKDVWSFGLRPLTVICGTNSSGKSTIIKALQLLSRALSTETADVGTPTLALSNRDVDVGPFDVFISHRDSSLTARIGLTLHVVPEYSDARHILGDLVGGERDLQIDCDFDFRATPRYSADLAQSAENTISGNRARLSAAYISVKSHDGQEVLSWRIISDNSFGNGRSTYSIHIPIDTARRLESAEFIMTDQQRKAMRSGAVKDISTNVMLRGLLPIYMAGPVIRRNRPETAAAPEIAFYQIPYQISLINRLISTELQQVQYLGPLRAAAERYYMVQGEDALDLDSSGEFLSRVLRRMNELRAVVPSKSKVRRPSTIPLERALNEWLYYLRTGKESAKESSGELTVVMTKDVLLEAQLLTANGLESHALADSGFGYSQVLPILIRCLIAGPGSTVLIEEPEVHLNPAVQVRLAEFFLAMIASDKQLLIETHSEHLVNAFRVLIAESPSGDAASNIEILFLDSHLRRPMVHKMSVLSDGSVPEWPAEFFGEALSLTKRLIAAQRNAQGASALRGLSEAERGV